MSKELKCVSTWSKASKLSISGDKTKWTKFHPTSKKGFMPTKFRELFIDGITLERQTVTKFLGVFINENVTWKAHVNTISTKISKGIIILYRVIPNSSKKTIKSLLLLNYFSFVLTLEYRINGGENIRGGGLVGVDFFPCIINRGLE